jgi:uncharacterized repeat protein (TIGR02543 family)
VAEKSKVNKQYVFIAIAFVLCLAIVVVAILYVTRTVAEYKVTIFVSSNNYTEKFIEKGEKLSRPVDPAAENGYRFGNWFADESCNTLYDFDRPINRDTVIYAGFVREVYIAVFYSNFVGTQPQSQEFLRDLRAYDSSFPAAVTTPSDPSGHYEFVCWADSPIVGPNTHTYELGAPVTMPIDGINLYAIWQGVHQTVTFAFSADAYSYGQPLGPRVDTSGRYGQSYTVPSDFGTVDHKNFEKYFVGFYRQDIATGVVDTSTIYRTGNTINLLGDVLFVEAWEASTSSVIFSMGDYNGGTPPAAKNYVAGHMFNLPIAERPHYILSGWSDGKGSIWAPETGFVMPESTMTLTAVWSEMTYLVSYDPNALVQGVMNSTSVLYNSIMYVPNNGFIYPDDKCEFKYWVTEENKDLSYEDIDLLGLTKYVAGSYMSNISSNITLYAIWAPKPKPMAVEYKLTNTGVAAASEAYVQGLFANDYTTEYGYYYTIPSYDASLILHEYNDKLFGGFKILNDLTNTAYTSGQQILVLDDITLVFNWVDTGNNIIFDLGGGYMTSVSVPSYVEGFTFTMPPVPSPERTNFEFRGWVLQSYLDEEHGGVAPDWDLIPDTWQTETVKFASLSGLLFVMPEGGITFVAVWRAAAYSIEFSKGLNTYIEGSMSMISTVFGASYVVTSDYDSVNSAVAGNLKVGFSYYGYEFMGWSTRANQTNPEYSIGSTIIMDAGIGNRHLMLYPCFKSIKIVIKYDGNGGTHEGMNIFENQNYYFGQFITLNQAFEKQNYEFVGWSVVSDATLTGYSNGDVRTVAPAGSTILVDSLFIEQLDALSISHFANGDITITLYAIWRGAQTNIVFSSNGGFGTMTAQSVRYGDTGVVLTTNTFVRNGYEFMGWSTSSNGSVEYADADLIDIAGPITLYAKWRGVAVTLTIYLNDHDYTYSPDFITITHAGGNILRFGDTYNFESIGNFVTVNPNKEFFRYNTLATGTGASYDPGSANSQDRSIVLGSTNNFYVIWKGKSKNVTYDLSDVRLDNGNTMSNKTSTGEYNQAFRLTHINVDYQVYRHYSPLGDPLNHYIVAGDIVAGLWISNIGSTSYTFVDGVTTIYPLGSNILITDNTVLKIYWTTDMAQAATVTFDLNNDTDISTAPGSINPMAGVINAQITLPVGPTRNNYIFDGWNTKADGTGIGYDAGDPYTLISAASTLYAQWTPKNKFIRYNANGGTFSGLALNGGDYLSSGIAVKATTLLATFTAVQLSKTDYELVGFSLSAQGNGGGQHVYAPGAAFYMAESLFSNSGAEVTEVTLYAIWRGQAVTINFLGQGGTISSSSPTYSITARVGDTVSLYNDFSRTGYTFKYFTHTSSDSGTKYCEVSTPLSFSINITTAGSITLYAQWQAQTMTVTIKKDTTGTVSYEIEVPYGGTWIMFDPSSTTDGWSFPTGDALWTTPDNGTFLGWKQGSTEYPWNVAYPGEIIVTDFVEFEAMWSVTPPITIIFDRGTGLINDAGVLTQVSISAALGGGFTIPGNLITYSGGTAQFSKAGFSFDGWTYITNSTEFYVGSNVMLNSLYFNTSDLSAYTITLTARFVSNTYIINYIAENGTFEGGYPTIVVVDPNVMPANYEVYGVNTVTHLSGNYILAGWDLMVAGIFDGVIDYTPLQIISTPTGNITLRAIWAPKTKTVDIVSGEATFVPLTSLSSGEKLTIEAAIATALGGIGGLGGLYALTAPNIYYPEVSNSTIVSIGVSYGSKINMYGEFGAFWLIVVVNASGNVTDIYVVEIDVPMVGLTPQTAKFFSNDNGITKHAIGGVNAGGAAVVIAGYVEYTILWQGEQRNVVFEGNGGTLGSHTTVYTSVHYVGETINLANIFVKDNSTFDKWLYSNDAESGSETYIAVGGAFTIDTGSYLHNGTDIVFVAQWTPNSVYINYQGNGGSILVQIAGQGTPYDTTDDEYSNQTLVQDAAPLGEYVYYEVISNPFIYSSFQFLYWSTSSASDATNAGTKYYPGNFSSGRIESILASLTLYAIWGLPQYTLTFNNNNGGVVVQVQARGPVVVPAPGAQFNGSLIDISKPYCKLLYWNTMPNGLGIIYHPGDTLEVNDNITLYAIWADIPVYVYFDANGGTGSVSYDPVARLVGASYITPQWFIEFTPPMGATFMGWSFDQWATEFEAVAAGQPIIIDGSFAVLVGGNPDYYEITLFAVYDGIFAAPKVFNQINTPFTYMGWYPKTFVGTALNTTLNGEQGGLGQSITSVTYNIGLRPALRIAI